VCSIYILDKTISGEYKEDVMAVITISRGSYSRGKEIAEEVAAKLGYKCISRDLLLEVSKEFNIPEIKLVQAIHDAPNMLDRLNHKKEKYIAFIKSALLNHLKEDNIVYHGLAGHFFVKDVPHVLKVRVVADMEERIKLEMERKGIDAHNAEYILKMDDKERREWSKDLYGIDTADPSLYDLVVHIKQLNVDDAVDMICDTVSKDKFKTTPESRRMIEDMALSATIHKILIDVEPDIKVCVDNQTAFIEPQARICDEENLVNEIKEITQTFTGISDVKIECHPIVAYSE
jgi:cytidylate kinase